MSSIRVYLKQGESDVLDFPVTPAEVGCNGSSEIQSSKINEVGSISLYGGNGLRSTEISSFFPSIKYDFCNYPDIKKPYEYVRQIEGWMYSGAKLRLIIGDTHTNIQVMINDFSYSERPGTRDVYFTISLTEYKEITLNKSPSGNSESNNTNRPSEGNPTTPSSKTHKVVKGDSLWSLAQRYYGSGTKHPQLRDKNKKKYPSLNKNSIIYVGWVLDI